MNLADVMDEIAVALGTISGLRVTAYTAQRINPPAAWVEWPDGLDYDAAMGRGSDRMTLPVRVAVGAVDSRSARDQLAAYVDGSGASSVKAAVEAHSTAAYDSARVTSVEFGVIPVAGVEYLAASFSVDIIGKGA